MGSDGEGCGSDDMTAAGMAAIDCQDEAPGQSGNLTDQAVFSDLTAAVGPSMAERVQDFAGRDYQRVIGVVSYVCGARVDPSSAVSEAVARLIEETNRGKRITNVAGWITKTAINVGLAELRHLSVRRRKLSVLAASQAHIDNTDLIAARLDVQRAISRLPRRQAQVVGLRYGLDLPIAEIAETLGISEGGAKSSLAKARRALAVHLGEQEGADDEQP
jgi:RNA polymerase sigma factor (sigma-70 family)